MSGILMTFVSSGVTPGPALETHTLTTGSSGTVGNRARGYILSSFGNFSPTATSLSGATQITQIYYDEAGPSYYLKFNGGTNSGWTYMTVDSTTIFTRAAATYDPVLFAWQWSTTDIISNQVFGNAGTTHSIVFS